LSKSKKSKQAPKVEFKAPPGLDEFLEDSEYYLSVKKDDTKVKDTLHLLGSIDLTLDEPLDQQVLSQVDELWLYVSKIPGRSFIYTEWLEDGGQVKNAAMNRIDDECDLSFLAGKNLYLQEYAAL